MRDCWDNIKCTNISIIGIPEKERENYIFDEIMAVNFPNLKKKTDIKVHYTQMGSNKVNPNRPTSRYTIMKIAKVKYKERMLKAVKKEEKKSYTRKLL